MVRALDAGHADRRRHVSAPTYRLVGLPDGRQLEVLETGDGPRALVWFWGTPGAAVPDPTLDRLADDYGLRLLQPNRPGYGQSDPRPGRRIVDLVGDVDVALQVLGVQDAVVMGGSGGGPHALAMAARLPQCRAAASLVSPAPRDAEGLDFYDGMAPSNQEEWRLADQGEDAVRPFLDKLVATSDDITVEGYADCFCPQDRAALEAADPEVRAARSAKGLERGVEGWLEDDLAMTTPWGFDLDEIDVPVSFWAGRQDRFVSFRHTLWMGERVPGASVHVIGDEGHLSLRLRHMDAMVQEVLSQAGWSA